MRISEWMTPSPIAVSPATSVARAHEIMLASRIRHLPVTEGDVVVGILTDRDVRSALPSPATSFSVGEIRFLWDKLAVEQIMTRPVLTIAPAEPLAEAVRLMVARKIGALPVTRHGRLVGIITETDLLRALASTLVPRADADAAAERRPDAGAQHNDGTIRKILVPLDGSVGSATVLPTIGELAAAEGAIVRLLHVAKIPADVRDEGRVISYVDQETARVEQESLAYLRRIAAGFDAVTVEFAVRFGDRVEQIVTEAQDAGASLIAMATHRRSGISRIVKGSVAEQVERGTAIPVMLVQYGERSAA